MEIEKIAVVGMGTMGSQIAVVCARGGFKTKVLETSEDRLTKGKASIVSFLDNEVKKQKMEPKARDRVLAAIQTTLKPKEVFEDADLVIEAVFEDIGIKREIFQEADCRCPSRTILASNTSTLSISELAAGTQRPDRCHRDPFLDSGRPDPPGGSHPGTRHIGRDSPGGDRLSREMRKRNGDRG